MRPQLAILALLAIPLGLPVASATVDHPGNEVCPLMSDPICWTIRLGCYYLDAPLHRLVPPNPIFWVNCTTQPEGDSGAVALADTRAPVADGFPESS